MDEKRLEEKIKEILKRNISYVGQDDLDEEIEESSKEIMVYIKEQLSMHPPKPWDKTY